MTKEKRKKRIRFQNRKKYLKWSWSLLAIGLMIIFSPLYTHSKAVKIDEAFTQPFLQSRSLDLVRKERVGKRQLAFEFAVDNDDDSLSKDLANLDYSFQVKTVKGDFAAIKPVLQKVSDEYFVVVLKHMPEDFEAMRISILSDRKDKNIDTELANQMDFYIKQKSIKKNITDDNYVAHAMEYKKGLITNQQKELQKENKKLEASIKLNQKMIKELKEEKNYQLSDEKEDTDTKISGYESDNELSTQKIEENKTLIDNLEQKKSSVGLIQN